MKYVLFFFIVITGLSVFAHDHGDYYHANVLKSMQEGDKAALLVVHFGTTHEDTREKTIDVINERFKSEFKDFEFREAYSSRMIIRRLKQRGVEKLNTGEALDRLLSEGYTHVIIQPTNIIEGIEMEAIRLEARIYQDKFKDVRVGNALLYFPDDYKETIKILADELKGNVEGDCIFICHGTYHPANSTYGMLDYVIRDLAYNDFHVSTLDGYPGMDEVVKELNRKGMKEVTLVPFMFVAGDHAKNDIAGDWKEELEEKGFKVNLYLRGMGEYSAIQERFIKSAKFAAGHKRHDILEKKKKYELNDDIHHLE